jgi:hypothetical protein
MNLDTTYIVFEYNKLKDNVNLALTNKEIHNNYINYIGIPNLYKILEYMHPKSGVKLALVNKPIYDIYLNYTKHSSNLEMFTTYIYEILKNPSLYSERDRKNFSNDKIIFEEHDVFKYMGDYDHPTELLPVYRKLFEEKKMLPDHIAKNITHFEVENLRGFNDDSRSYQDCPDNEMDLVYENRMLTYRGEFTNSIFDVMKGYLMVKSYVHNYWYESLCSIKLTINNKTLHVSIDCDHGS